MCDIPCPTVGEQRPRHRRQTLRQISLWQMCQSSGMVKAIPHNSKCRYSERGAADAKPKAQIILDAAKVSAASGGNSEPKQGQRSQSARGFCPRSTMRVPQPDIIEHFDNADAVPQLPERCLSRKAGIVRCCPRAYLKSRKFSLFLNTAGFCMKKPWNSQRILRLFALNPAYVCEISVLFFVFRCTLA